MKPKIRFKGFEGEWKEVKLGEIGSWSKGKLLSKDNISETGKFKCIHYGELFTMYNEIIYQVFSKTDLNNGCLSQFGDILFPDSDVTPTGLARCSSIMETGVILGGGIHILRPLPQYYSPFISLSVNNEKQQIISRITGTTVRHINAASLSEIEIVCTENIAEQEKIASYFTSLDSQISASTSRLASLKQMKAASLQAMFPQEGEIVPKIRFKGFEGEWKTCVLSSIATMHARIGWQNLRKDEFLSSGDYYLITGTDFHDGKISFETCHYIDKERYDQDKNIQLEIDSILITKDGTLGKVAFVDSLDKPATLNAGIFNVRTKDKEIYPKYLFQYLKAPYLMDYVNKNATGGTIKHLNQNMLVNFPVQYPSYKEQVMIGDYLFNLDRQISLQSQRLEKLKQIKSACLDKMFV